MAQTYSQATKRKLLSLQGRVLVDTLRETMKVFDHPVQLTGEEMTTIRNELSNIDAEFADWKDDALAFLNTCVIEEVAEAAE